MGIQFVLQSAILSFPKFVLIFVILLPGSSTHKYFQENFCAKVLVFEKLL